ncbi:Impact RWD domain protein transcript variant X2 [Paragonimus heterotremus]|uniref:Impact RWD domain protein transcript variant X2 n=1 Tax=Paragonimus heterotremus TaxID=100268 RepID=A0A8J4SZ21_9TREM|nr:Impact RWD domain protein transcript variant X2 [Paragonimus heterotremus]
MNLEGSFTHSNRVAQEEELLALSSIYDKEFYTVEPETNLYAIYVTSDSGKKSVTLQFQYPPGYPLDQKLIYELQAPWLRGPAYDDLQTELNQHISSTAGAPVVHLLVESIRKFLQSCANAASTPPPADQFIPEKCHVNPVAPASSVVPSVRAHLNCLPELMPIGWSSKTVEIFHGEPFVDRKSVFQAHACRVETIGAVSRFISSVLEDRKVAVATHNILAWRLVTKSNTGTSDLIHSDCDDDGETHAGSRLLHLLTISGVENVAVMVSRWYGGIQLGPDRFKHINNVARQLLAAQCFLDSRSGVAVKQQHSEGKSKTHRQNHKKKK